MMEILRDERMIEICVLMILVAFALCVLPMTVGLKPFLWGGLRDEDSEAALRQQIGSNL